MPRHSRVVGRHNQTKAAMLRRHPRRVSSWPIRTTFCRRRKTLPATPCTVRVDLVPTSESYRCRATKTEVAAGHALTVLGLERLFVQQQHGGERNREAGGAREEHVDEACHGILACGRAAALADA